MFTGIVEESGEVVKIGHTAVGIRLEILTRKVGGGLKIGDSLAVNGCCLTVVSRHKNQKGTILAFDLLQETWSRTSFEALKAGNKINLERALSAQGRLGGHFVTGHVDGVGIIKDIRTSGADRLVRISAPVAVLPYLIYKGSISLDGISLTVANVTQRSFRVWIIPHTWSVTNLAQRIVGDRVNLEGDLLGKYVARFLESRSQLEKTVIAARRSKPVRPRT